MSVDSDTYLNVHIWFQKKLRLNAQIMVLKHLRSLGFKPILENPKQVSFIAIIWDGFKILLIKMFYVLGKDGILRLRRLLKETKVHREQNSGDITNDALFIA